jgi:hypothetical protein
VHYVGVVFPGEDVAGSSHVGCELINFIEAAVDHLSHKVGIAKVADREVIGFCLTETWEFEIGSSDPKAFPLEPPYKMVTDEATGPTDQRDFSGDCFPRHVITSWTYSVCSDFVSGLAAQAWTLLRAVAPPALGQATALRVKCITRSRPKWCSAPRARCSFHAAGESAER